MLERRDRLLLRGLTITLMLYQTAALFISGQVITFILYGVLLIMLRQGYNWARIVLGGLLLLTAGVGILGLTGAVEMRLPYPAATLFILIGYIVAGLWLLCSPPLRRVFRKRAVRDSEEAADV